MWKIKDPAYIVVDVREIILMFSENSQHYELYRKFPLQDIIGTVLASSASGGPSEYIWHMLDYKLGNDLDKFDMNVLELFFEYVMLCLDEHIGKRVPSNIDVSEYIFHKWVSADSMLLIHENCCGLSPLHH